MDKHLYGERVLDRNPPPSGATGLIIREQIYKDSTQETPWYKRVLGYPPVERFFIFRVVVGSHDYRSRSGESMCGSYHATMGYWHYDTATDRDAKYEELLDLGYKTY